MALLGSPGCTPVLQPPRCPTSLGVGEKSCPCQHHGGFTKHLGLGMERGGRSHALETLPHSLCTLSPHSLHIPLPHNLCAPQPVHPTTRNLCTPSPPNLRTPQPALPCVLPKPCPGQSHPGGRAGSGWGWGRGRGPLRVLPRAELRAAEPATATALAAATVALTAVKFSGPQSRPRKRQLSSMSRMGCPARW